MIDALLCNRTRWQRMMVFPIVWAYTTRMVYVFAGGAYTYRTAARWSWMWTTARCWHGPVPARCRDRGR